MAFNLKKVLKALLLSSGQPLSIKDIQAAFTRFHEQATLPVLDESAPEGAPVEGTEAEEGAPAVETATEGAAPVPAAA
jgi:segregation and condensation protein B